MQVSQFHKEFKIAFDKADSGAYPEFLPAEIDTYLNEAQDRFVKTRYGRNNIYKLGYEELQKRTEDLKALSKSKYCAVSPVDYYHASGDKIYKADLDSMFDDIALAIPYTGKYMLWLKASVQVKISTCTKWSRVKLIQQDDVSGIDDDPFNKASAERPLVFFEDGGLCVWTGKGSTVEAVLVSFFKYPDQINIGTYGGALTQCELSDHTHREILQMAVGIAIENISSPRVQTHDALNVQRIE